MAGRKDYEERKERRKEKPEKIKNEREGLAWKLKRQPWPGLWSPATPR